MSNSTRDFALGYLASKGVPAHVAAGIVGNLAIESGNFSKDVISGKKAGDKGASKYAGQWNKERLDNYEAFAKATGRHPSDFTAQLDFIAEEMNENSPYADPQAAKNRDAIFTAQTPEEAAQAFQDHYERPNPQLANTKGRQAIAVQSYEAYLSGPVANAPTPYGRDEDPLAPAPQVAAAPAMSGREIVPGLGLANLTPSAFSSFSNYDRTNLDPSLGPVMDALHGQIAIGNLPDMGINSGYRSPSKNATVGGARRSQHMQGKALDINVAGLTDQQKAEALQTAVEAGAKGVGIYGSGRTIHVDTRTNPALWGGIPGAPYAGMGIDMAPSWAQPTLNEMFAAGPFAVTPHNVPTPFSAPSMVAGAPQAGPSARSAQEQSMAALSQAAPSIASAPQAGPSARSAEEMSMAALSAQPSFAPSPRSAEDYSMAAFAPSQPAQTATEALDALAAPQDEQIDMGSWGQVAQAAPQSINIAQAPAIAPMQAPVAPAPAPVAYSAPAPVSRTPAPSMASGLDFWGGKANVAVSNSGAQLSRDIHGNTYNYSPTHDITTISNSLGDVIGTQKGEVSIDATGNPSGGKGLFSGGIFGDDGVFGDTFSKGGFQNAVVGGLGGLGGSIVGGMVGGPIGGIVGSALGRSLAQSKFGVPAINPMAITPQQMAAALASYSGGLAFPDAPTGGAGWGGWVDGSGPGSRGYAESISPGATAAIDAGKGGLY